MARGQFTHKTDKSQITTTEILGVNIADINLRQLTDFTTENLENMKGDEICVANVENKIIDYENES